MPSVSRERIANVDDHGVVEDRHEDVDGTTISFVTIREDVDAARRSSAGCRTIAARARTGATPSRGG